MEETSSKCCKFLSVEECFSKLLRDSTLKFEKVCGRDFFKLL